MGATEGSVRFIAGRDTTNRAVSLLLSQPGTYRGGAAALQPPHLRTVLLEADTPALRHSMQAAGFSRFSYHPYRRALSPISGPASSCGHNQLWIRDLPFVQERLRTAPLVRVNGLEL